MALTINESLTTPDGGTIASGAYVKFTTVFHDSDYRIEFGMKVYRSEDDFNDGKSTVKKINEFPNVYIISIDYSEYITLTPLKVHEILRDWILDRLGYGGATSGTEGIIDITI